MPHPRLHSRRPTHYVLRIFEQFTDLSYGKLFSVWAAIVLFVAIGYFLLSTYMPEHGVTGLAGLSPLQQFGNSLYLSVMTVTTVGYGDHAPLGFSKFLAAIEGVFGFFVFATFITKLVSYESEIMMHETHSLMFENKFHLTREGFFTIRKDLDAVMRDMDLRGTVTDDDWDKLAIAYWEGQRLLESIPVFYGDGHAGQDIDAKRERLLVETVHRTCERLLKLLRMLDEKKVDWRGHANNGKELADFVGTLETEVKAWRRSSLHRNDEWFDRLAKTVVTLR